MLSNTHNGQKFGPEELKLTCDIVDIMDELKMIRTLLDTQKEVLGSMRDVLLRLHPGEANADKQQPGGLVVHNSTFDSIKVVGAPSSLVQLFDISAATLEIEEGAGIPLMTLGIKGLAGTTIRKANSSLENHATRVQRLQADASTIHRRVCSPEYAFAARFSGMALISPLVSRAS